MRRGNLILGLIGPLLVTFTAARGHVAPKLEFEAAFVRASAPQADGERVPPNGDTNGGPGTSDPARMTFFRVPLSNILMTAFDVPANRLKAPGVSPGLAPRPRDTISPRPCRLAQPRLRRMKC